MEISKKITLYNSDNKEDEEYWDISETAKKYDIDIVDTNEFVWGGEKILEVKGTLTKLNKFAEEFCNAEDITWLEVE